MNIVWSEFVFVMLFSELNSPAPRDAEQLNEVINTVQKVFSAVLSWSIIKQIAQHPLHDLICYTDHIHSEFIELFPKKLFISWV